MNIFLELLTWYQSKGDDYRNSTLLEKCVEDFLAQRAKTKMDFPCKSLKHVKENVVSILGLMGNEHFTTKDDLMEIDNCAMEIYDYLSKSKVK